MEKITTFDIDVDVSNCEKLYDYGHSKYYHRPAEGQWDFNVFADREPHSRFDKAIENIEEHVESLDNVFHQTKALEKMKKMTKSHMTSLAGMTPGSHKNFHNECFPSSPLAIE